MTPVTFCVPLEWTSEPWTSTPTRWLDAEGASTEDPDRAIWFRFRPTRSARDDRQIERNLDELNEGIGGTVDLEIAIEGLREVIRREIELELWPEGRPPAPTAEEQKAQETLMAAGFLSEARDRNCLALHRMIALQDRDRFMATWPVLILDPPEDWASIADRQLAPGRSEMIARAFIHAMEGANAGK